MRISVWTSQFSIIFVHENWHILIFSSVTLGFWRDETLTSCKCLAPFPNAEETWQQIVFGRKVEESQTELVPFKRGRTLYCI